MSYGYEALTTKVKAMYGKRLRHADYVRMARMGSVDEVLDDLRRHPVWGPAAAKLSEGARFGRARLEGALREQVREEYLRFDAFIPRKDRALMEFPVLKAELDGLLFTLSRLRAGRDMEPEPLPLTFIRQSKTDEDALYACTDYEGLLASTRGSIFYQPLVKLRQPGGALPDYTPTESALYAVYYTHMLEVVRQRYEGEVRTTLERHLGAQVDMLNILHLLRLKHFFPEERDYLSVLYPVRYKLKPETVQAMCAAPDPAAVLELAAATPYAEHFKDADPAGLDTVYERMLFRMSRRQLMLGEPSIYSAVAFLNLREQELHELITVIETVKYQAQYDDSFARELGR